MVQLYIKYIDGNYYLLDLEDTEAINYKLTVKDLTNITTIFSPFTQAFSLAATDKNKMLCGFVGNEKILRLNNDGVFDSMIYISGFLFQSGKLTFDKTNYQFLDQKGFKTNFASNLTSLTDKLGDTTIQELFQDANKNFDEVVRVDWNVFTLKDRLASVKNFTLSNGIEFKYGIPFISNNRVWTFDDDNLGTVDNIAYKKARTADTVNQISLGEIRPAVNYMAIMNHLLLKIGTPVTCPLFEKPELKDLFAWCTGKDLVVPDAAAYPLINYNAITYDRYDEKDEISGVAIPGDPKWFVTGGLATGIFKIERNEFAQDPSKWSDGLDVNLIFNTLVSLEGPDTKIKVVLKNATTGTVLDSQEITNNNYVYRLLDSILDVNGEIFLKLEILPTTLLKWNSIEFKTVQQFRYSKGGFLGNRVTRATYSASAINNTSSASLGGNKLNLVTALPKMKCVDFLKSFFNTFNISVISTGKQDQSMFWVTPSDIQEVNKPYSKRIVDWTNFVDIATLDKEKGNKYNQYVFTHFDSKYYEAVYGNGVKFGSLTYPETAPAKPTKFEVKTNYSLIKQAATFNHPSSAKTCLGFVNAAPEVLDNGGNRYNPVYDEFTLFYLQNKSLGIDSLSVEYTQTINNQLFSVLEASPVNSVNGKSLQFGDGDSLYLNYYKSFIELLLRANTYKSEFNLTLPANEIFLNFANLNQGESNIPTGYRPQNEIVIGEQRYSQTDITIDLTTGKAKLTSLNF